MLNDIVLVLFCSCYVFIVSLIAFALYIITNYMDDVRLSHLNKDYLLTYLLISFCRPARADTSNNEMEF